MRKAIRRVCRALAAVCLVLGGLMWGAAGRLPDAFLTEGDAPVTLDGALSVIRIRPASADVRLASAPAEGGYTASATLFGLFPVKTVAVRPADERRVIVGGTPFGVKMYTDGVLVVGLTDVDTAAGDYNPARSAGIKIGDVIESIDGQTVSTNEQVAALVEQSGGKTMDLQIRRDNLTFHLRFTPARHRIDGRWKAGLWVRDSSAGIGTLTFCDPASGAFAGLGHAVCDVDTGEILPIAGGEIVPVEIYSVARGADGAPGELRGGFAEGTLGTLAANTATGVFGRLTADPPRGDRLPVALKQQVKTGPAQVIVTVEGNTPRRYDIVIERVRLADPMPGRNMVIRVTDPQLLEATGGIVQGMSGSPIVQDGKLIGAVTHVYVNDPTRGFAIFAETMLQSADKAVARPAA
ncbi:MAG: SpoIVB peptidase [Acutalibacteraceae bacterium]